MAEEKENDDKLIFNDNLNLFEALIPVLFLISLLAVNVLVFGDDALGGSNQFVLLLAAAVAAIIGFLNKISYDQMITAVGNNFKSTTGAILILLMVGALSGTWLLSGVIPAMIYYGLQICLLYTSPSPRDRQKSRMPSSA